ncbi:MAG: phosphotransferase [Acidimicrobiales bacterium]
MEPLGAAGFLSTLARIALLACGHHHRGPCRSWPSCRTQNVQNRRSSPVSDTTAEAGVSRDLRPWERAPAVRTIAQGTDPGTGDLWLLLEDLEDHRAADGAEGASDPDAFATVSALARWHAAWWNDERLTSLDWLPATPDPLISGYGQIFDWTWEMCVDRLGGVDPEVAASARAGRTWFDTAVREFAAGDRTLVHGDARLDNVLFAPEGDAVLIDFQLASHGRGAYDLAFFCAGSLRTADRRRLEPALLDHYRTTLAERGVAVRLDELWRDYRLGLMLNLPHPVSALAAVTPADERGARFLRRNAQRGLAAVADHVGLLG